MSKKEPLEILRSPTEAERTAFEHTAVIIVTTIPTVGEDGIERIGGAGASSLAKLLQSILQDESVLVQTGEKLRQLSAQIIEVQGESEFYVWRSQLLQSGNYDFDRLVDNEAATEVVEQLKTHPIVIFDTKIGDQLNQLQGDLPVFVIGVDVPDYIGTERSRRRQIAKGELEDSGDHYIILTQRDDVAYERAMRYQNDRSIYRGAYNLDYSRKAKLAIANAILDNSADLTPPDQTEQAWGILWQMAQYIPVLSQVLVKITSA